MAKILLGREQELRLRQAEGALLMCQREPTLLSNVCSAWRIVALAASRRRAKGQLALCEDIGLSQRMQNLKAWREASVAIEAEWKILHQDDPLAPELQRAQSATKRSAAAEAAGGSAGEAGCPEVESTEARVERSAVLHLAMEGWREVLAEARHAHHQDQRLRQAEGAVLLCQREPTLLTAVCWGWRVVTSSARCRHAKRQLMLSAEQWLFEGMHVIRAWREAALVAKLTPKAPSKEQQADGATSESRSSSSSSSNSDSDSSDESPAAAKPKVTGTAAKVQQVDRGRSASLHLAMEGWREAVVDTHHTRAQEKWAQRSERRLRQAEASVVLCQREPVLLITVFLEWRVAALDASVRRAKTAIGAARKPWSGQAKPPSSQEERIPLRSI